MTLTLQKVTIKINENRTFYLLERNVIRMKRRIQALTLALCFCTAFLFSSCSFMQKQEEPQVQNHSELTSTESFPIKLNVGEEEYLIASKPRSLAVLSADLVQALGDIGAASLISGACTDAPSSVSLSASQSCGTALNPNLQQLISVRPDWVLVSVPMRQSSIEQLEQAGIQVICFDYPDSIDSIKERYRTLFSLCYGLEGTQKAEAFLNEYQQRLDTAIQPASEYVRVTSKRRRSTLRSPTTPWQPAKRWKENCWTKWALTIWESLAPVGAIPRWKARSWSPTSSFTTASWTRSRSFKALCTASLLRSSRSS